MGEVKGFYWNSFIKNIGHTLLREKEDEEDVVDTLCGLIKYRVKTFEKLQNVGRSEYKLFTEKFISQGSSRLDLRLAVSKVRGGSYCE